MVTGYYLLSLSESDLADFIKQSKSRVILALPMISSSIANSILSLNSQFSDIKVLVNFSESTFREGYGEEEDLKAIKQLHDQKIQVLNFHHNLISFIIVDEQGYLLFPECKFLPSSKLDKLNAIRMDNLAIAKIHHQLFPVKPVEYQNILENALIEDSRNITDKSLSNTRTLRLNTDPISTEEIKVIEEELLKNPPLKPDFRILVEYYQTKFQYVDLSFKGGNIHKKKINLPKRALPFRNSQLRDNLEAKLQIFDNIANNEEFNCFFNFKDNIEHIRAAYTIYLNYCNRRVIRKTSKKDFLIEIDSLEKKLVTVKESLISFIDEQISKAKINVFTELDSFYIENSQTKDAFAHMKAKDDALEITNKIHWPKASTMIEDMKIEYFFSELTFEDLINKDFQKEMHQVGFINEEDEKELADFGKGMEVEGE